MCRSISGTIAASALTSLFGQASCHSGMMTSCMASRAGTDVLVSSGFGACAAAGVTTNPSPTHTMKSATYKRDMKQPPELPDLQW
jgi:hypothetical protein